MTSPLTVKQAAALLGLSARAVYDLAAPNGPIPCSRPAKRRVVFELADLEEYKAKCRYTATANVVRSSLSSTAASPAQAVSGLASAFRKLGIKPRLMPTTAASARGSEILGKITGSTVLDPLRQYVEPSLMRFQPFGGQGGSSTGSAAAMAFAFLRTVFCGGQAGRITRRGRQAGRGRSRKRVVTCTPCALRGNLWFESRGHHKASSVVRARIDAANGRMSSAHPPKRWRYVSPGASGLVAGTATNRQCMTKHVWPTIRAPGR